MPRNEKVTRIVDGSTFATNMRKKTVKLARVNALERGKRRTAAVKKELEKLILGQTVTIDTVGRDDSGCAAVMCNGEGLLPNHLPNRLISENHQPQMSTIPVGTTMQEVEQQMIAQTMKWTNHNRQQAAVILGISHRTLYNKIAKYGL